MIRALRIPLVQDRIGVARATLAEAKPLESGTSSLGVMQRQLPRVLSWKEILCSQNGNHTTSFLGNERFENRKLTRSLWNG
ncbi:hypothetical protein M2275_001339 [Rhodococcus opacus]|nr:hypothetical protein [Rhodococcus opacus]